MAELIISISALFGNHSSRLLAFLVCNFSKEPSLFAIDLNEGINRARNLKIKLGITLLGTLLNPAPLRIFVSSTSLIVFSESKNLFPFDILDSIALTCASATSITPTTLIAISGTNGKLNNFFIVSLFDMLRTPVKDGPKTNTGLMALAVISDFSTISNISNLLIDENQLKNKNASFYKINRGGDITYHGPGQIVCYPILDLENFFTDIHKYLRFLEETVILALENYGIKGERNNGKTGVWMDVDTPFPRKICAMGVRASRWVTMHGFALNVNVDLDYFNNIVPCGLTNNIVTSIYNERKDYDLAINDVKSDLKECFSKTFNSTFI